MKFTFILAAMLFSQFSFAGTVVLVETNKGNFEIELNDEKAPISSENFLKYVDSGFYNGTIFHRSVKNFVVQGGGLTSDMQEKTTLEPIPSEAKNGLSNLKGTLGMARTEDINSATSQFYVNTKDNTGLDFSPVKAGYAVFGKVISGYEVIEAIENAPVHSVGEYDNVPTEAIVIKAITRKNSSERNVSCEFSGFYMKSDGMISVKGNFNIGQALADASHRTNLSITYEGSDAREFKNVITTVGAGDSQIMVTPNKMLKALEAKNPLVLPRWKEKLEKITLASSSEMYNFPFNFTLQDWYVYRYYDSSNKEIGKIFGFGNKGLVVCD